MDKIFRTFRTFFSKLGSKASNASKASKASKASSVKKIPDVSVTERKFTLTLEKLKATLPKSIPERFHKLKNLAQRPDETQSINFAQGPDELSFDVRVINYDQRVIFLIFIVQASIWADILEVFAYYIDFIHLYIKQISDKYSSHNRSIKKIISEVIAEKVEKLKTPQGTTLADTQEIIFSMEFFPMWFPDFLPFCLDYLHNDVQVYCRILDAISNGKNIISDVVNTVGNKLQSTDQTILDTEIYDYQDGYMPTVLEGIHSIKDIQYSIKDNNLCSFLNAVARRNVNMHIGGHQANKFINTHEKHIDAKGVKRDIFSKNGKMYLKRKNVKTGKFSYRLLKH